MAQNHSAMSLPSGAPPEKYPLLRPPNPWRILEKTSWSASFHARPVGCLTGGDLLFVFFAHVQGPVKYLSLQSMARLTFGFLAHFFIDPRHGNNDGRLGFLQHLRELVKDSAVHNGDAVEIADVVHMARRYMRQRKKGKVNVTPAPTPPVCWP